MPQATPVQHTEVNIGPREGVGVVKTDYDDGTSICISLLPKSMVVSQQVQIIKNEQKESQQNTLKQPKEPLSFLQRLWKTIFGF